MSFFFGDGFDVYSANTDPIGYWDSALALTNLAFAAGRFSGSRALNINTTGSGYVKSSGQNDAVHHLVFSIYENQTVSGTSGALYFAFSDGATAQCTVQFTSGGNLILQSGGVGGTVLATYTGAIAAQATWYAFEIEVVISNTAGSIAVRKNGNTVNDFFLGGLNTRVSANNYANKITMGMQFNNNFLVDDILWRSDATSGSGQAAWVGDVRCYTRMPAADVTTQFIRQPTTLPVFSSTGITTSGGPAANTIWYYPITATTTNTVASLSMYLINVVTGNVNMALYDSSGAAGAPGNLIATCNALTNPVGGSGILQTFTFTTPPTVTKGVKYWIAYYGNAALTIQGDIGIAAGVDFSQAFTYTGSFPATATPVALGSHSGGSYVGMNVTAFGYQLVSESQQDGATTYIYDSNIGDADMYGISALAASPATTLGVVTRAFAQKSDAGTRGACVQMKSGGTTVQGPAIILGTSWSPLYRVDTVDPATSAAWSAAAVNNLQIGVQVTA
jgi:hypothetical protein